MRAQDPDRHTGARIRADLVWHPRHAIAPGELDRQADAPPGRVAGPPIAGVRGCTYSPGPGPLLSSHAPTYSTVNGCAASADGERRVWNPSTPTGARPAVARAGHPPRVVGLRISGIRHPRPRPSIVGTESSDDPVYANTLAGVLSDAGRPREAERWRVRAANRYHELVSHHPDAFAHHVSVVDADQRTKHPPPGHAGLSTCLAPFRS